MDLLRLGKTLVIDRSNGLGSLLDNETCDQFFNLWHLLSRKQKFPLGYCSSALFLNLQLLKLKQLPKSKEQTCSYKDNSQRINFDVLSSVFRYSYVSDLQFDQDDVYFFFDSFFIVDHGDEAQRTIFVGNILIRK